MKKAYLTAFLSTALTAAAMAATPAYAAGIVYATDNNPWGNLTNDAAMDSAFGAGNWTKSNYDAGLFSASNSFLFIDGSDSNGNTFSNFITTNLTALTSFVNNGGVVFANMASNTGPNSLALPFGYSSSYPNFSPSASLTAAGVTAGLDASGAGLAWSGNYFGHNTLAGGTCYVLGSAGCVFAGSTQGAGAFFAGGQTTTNFHSAGGAQLLVNELQFASGFGGVAGAVPEPATWMMMILGFGAVGGTMRYRQRKSAVSFA